MRLATKRIVIGENMRRVRAAAKDYSAGYYLAWTIAPFDFDLAMKRNRRWLLEKMRGKYEIIDIGIDPDRLRRSDFYAMERGLLAERGYSIRRIY